ncbi:uncharacterized protein EI97DRAFT_368477 [Westerdykella ornata]|uniref:Uncharacterized protein n=1 Tax=Westerdykella ornata TaxID=318751 RepID=A0A6A6JXK6_WESOR|nr:uncharacterized protein EI97DRAFT_368477 [Westerdykella ornata]KAF2280924.1 hypothetical protein EI97DRAFT_368477 [Westerdykella ornata]
MHPEALPPYRHISNKPISLSAASALLDTYITNSETHPHLHPDALITPSGVTFSSHGGPLGGVIMHNLRRVAAGLRGEYLEPEATPEPEEQGVAFESKKKQGNKQGPNDASGTEEGWQDLSEYEREEGEDAEVGEKRKAKEDKEARKKAKKARDKEFKKQKEMRKKEKKEE